MEKQEKKPLNKTQNQNEEKNHADKGKFLELVYFVAHNCSLSPKDQGRQEQEFGRVRKFILYLTMARPKDIRARRMYRSYAAFRAEIDRQSSLYPFSIHPFSRLRLFVDISSTFVLLGLHTLNCVYASHNQVHKTFETMERMFAALFLPIVITNFFTGYVAGITSQYIVMDLKKISLRYIRTWFVVDLIFCSSLLADWYLPQDISYPYISKLLYILKVPAVLAQTSSVLDVFSVRTVIKTAAELTLLIYYYLIWNVFCQFYVEYVLEGSFKPKNPSPESWMSVTGVWNATPTERFIYAFHRSVHMLRQNSNLNLLSSGRCYVFFFIISWITAELLVLHCLLKVMITYFGIESARASYFKMTQQVLIYLNQRKFPDRIKKKILKFYSVRFHSHFFLESRLMACVSGQLREDIIMHSARQLVSQVEFLKQLPRPLLLQIGTKLKLVIFLAGDIIFKIHTVGDCLYFIDKGIVAIYSESGKEICHLEDGNFFGEISLTMKPRYRACSAVAVTNCELFKLDRKDFDSTIAVYPTVYEDIKKVAAQRLEQSIVKDDHHKAELWMGKNQNHED